MTEHIEYLDLEDLIDLASMLLGDPPPIRDVGLLDSAATRPRATAFGAEAYRDVWSKATAVLQSVVKNRALVDGNKRLGWLATAVFLELNGVSVTQISNDEVYRFVIDAAAGHDEIEDLASRLQHLAAH